MDDRQRWSPRGRLWLWGRPLGHIVKSLTLTSKPQVLKNCSVLGSRTALFLNRWNFVGKRQKPCRKSAKTFFWFLQVEIAWNKVFEDLFRLKTFWTPFFEIAWKKFFKTFSFFFGEHLRLCPWSLVFASRGSVLGLEIFMCPWPWPRALCLRLHLRWLDKKVPVNTNKSHQFRPNTVPNCG